MDLGLFDEYMFEISACQIRVVVVEGSYLHMKDCHMSNDHSVGETDTGDLQQ